MTHHRNLTHPAWQYAAAIVLVLSLVLAGISPAQAARTAAHAEFVAFDDGSYPTGLVYGPGGSIWVTLSKADGIGQVTGVTKTLHPLPQASSKPWDITIGPDKALWFVEADGDRVGRLDVNGEITEFSLVEGAYPTAITLGQDLALWFTERGEERAGRIGRIEPDGTLTYFSPLNPDSEPISIISAPDGNLWYADWNFRLGKITLQGEITEYELSEEIPEQPVDLLYGPDGGIWIVLNRNKAIARFDPASETFTRYEFKETANESFSDLAFGPDNRIWFVGTRTVGAFDPTNPTGLTEETLSGQVFGQGRTQIIAGPNNDLIFTTANTSKLFRTEIGGAPVMRDLQVFITYRPPLLLANGPFRIDAEIVNWTNAEAADLVIDLTLDDRIHFVSASITGGDCVDLGASVSCTVPSLDAGASLPVSFELTTDRINTSRLEQTLSLEVQSAEGDYQPANNRVVLFTTIQTWFEYFNDFSSGAGPGWSPQTTGTPVAGLKVLGPFGEDEVTFDLKNLPFHNRAWLCYDLYVTGPWGGDECQVGGKTVVEPDLWLQFLNEDPLLITTFANRPQCKQSFPNNYLEALHPHQTGAAETGEFDGDATIQDARYRLCYEREHTALSLHLLFKGLDLDQMKRKRWSIDNVHIKLYYDTSIERTYLPLLLR